MEKYRAIRQGLQHRALQHLQNSRNILSIGGIHTPCMQQWRAMTKEIKVDDLDPRLQQIYDLILLIQKNHTKVSLPIVIGDFNEDMEDSEKTGIKHLLATCNLVNAFHTLTGSTPSSRQNNRSVFHIFVHPHLLNYINQIGVMDEVSYVLLPWVDVFDLAVFC